MGLMDKLKGLFLKEQEPEFSQEEIDNMTVGEKINNGVANLWDLVNNKDELSSYGTVMQEEIIRESAGNTDFDSHDSNGANILHVLAASSDSLDDLMIGELKASHLAVFVHMLNEKDNDGRTPVDDMVENHGFEVKVDPEYGVIPNEFNMHDDEVATLEADSGNDSEFGDMDIGDDPGGDFGID